MSGGVELYIPSNRSLQGELASMIGKLDVRLNDIEQLKEHEQFLQRSMRFEKRVEGDDKPLQVKVESKTGTIMLHYNFARSEEHTSELQSRFDLVCRLLLEKKKPDID